MDYFTRCRTLDEIKAEYKRLARKHHPDMGGDTRTMQEINRQYEAAFHAAKGAARTETTETAAEFIAVIDALMKLHGITVELCGCWLWISGDTRAVKEELKAAGCRWAPKKGMWYWRPAGQHTRKGGGASMERIRAKYGSRTITRRDGDMTV